MTDCSKYIKKNKTIHDKVLSKYNKIHTDIYNPTEQSRIKENLGYAVQQIDTSTKIPLILDFGAGTGNLTSHLINLNAQVVAADVSKKCLEFVNNSFVSTNRIETLLLNGTDLSNIKDSYFDMVATYSVLHHVPDYLGILKEFARVVKPGGVIFIDHERSPSFWKSNCEIYSQYKREYEERYRESSTDRFFRRIKCLASINAWKRLINRKIHKIGGEGDIHVFKDDHIEWDLIDDVLKSKCSIIRKTDYLVCKEIDPESSIYSIFKNTCEDTRMVIYKKNLL